MIVLFEEEKCKHGYYSSIPEELGDYCTEKIKRFSVEINRYLSTQGYIIKKVDCTVERIIL